MRLIVEGWHLVPHSYGVVDQFLSLELSRRPDVLLSHREIPFVDPEFIAGAESLRDEAMAGRLRRIAAATAGQVADATLRFFVPLDLSAAPTGRTLVFATAELGILDRQQIGRSTIPALNAAPNIAMLTPSNWSRAGLIRGGVDPDKVVVIPHGVDPAIFSPANESDRNAGRRALGWEGEFVFLNIGAMTANKGIVDLLKAFAQIAAKFPAARLVLKGMDQIYRSDLSLNASLNALSATERQSVVPRLTYIGDTLTYAQTAALYQAADAYVSPYRAEGFNLPVLEAAACGLPVVCTAHGPTDEFTDNSFALRIDSRQKIVKAPGIAGAVELAPSLDSLARQMQRVLADRVWVGQARLAGPQYVRERFTWRQVADQILDVAADSDSRRWWGHQVPRALADESGPSPQVSALRDDATRAYQAGNLEQARAICRRILQIQPLNADAVYLLGAISVGENRGEAALLHFHHAAQLRPQSGLFHNALGESFQALGKLVEAERCFNAAIDAQPGYERPYLNLGLLMHGRGDLANAAIQFGIALRIKPDYATAHNNLGGVLHAQERLTEAESHFRRALQLRGDYPEAHLNLGMALEAGGNPRGAAECFAEAIRLRPRYARAHAMLGQALVSLGQVAASVDRFRTAIACNADDMESQARLADVLRLLGFHAQAAEVLETALQRRPNHPQCLVQRFRLRSETCDWRDWRAQADMIWRVTAEEIRAGRPTPIHPLFAISMPWTGAQQLAVAKSHSASFARFGKAIEPAPAVLPPPEQRLRIGYLSRDFNDHPVGHQIHRLFALHDRNRFEIYVYSFGPDDKSVYRRHIEQSSEHFRDVTSLPVGELVGGIREDGIQILVDLMGYSGIPRTAVLASRAAPIQVAWLGYPGTMGAEFIDYIIGDERVTPAGSEAEFTEKIIRLPHSYMIADGSQEIDPAPITRAGQGLPDNGIVFCCFNNAHKIDPEVFDIWMRILHRLPGSVAWLSVREAIAQKNLRHEAEARGIDSNRLIFSVHAKSKATHLKRLGLADLFLDTHYYNAHVTACDAIRAGVPVLTCPADTFASRVGSSLLNAMGMQELIVPDLQAYEEKAVSLALNKEELNRLRSIFVTDAAAVFDPNNFARELESAYTFMATRRDTV